MNGCVQAKTDIETALPKVSVKVGKPNFHHTFLFKLLVAFSIIIAIYSVFMAVLDPYNIIGNDISKKTLPYFPLYQYNYIKHYKNVDYGFLGSSAINYIPIEKFYPADKRLFSMGIESSNIHEHIAYGKVLAAKSPKEITFFITFYALNPARGNQKYFNEAMVSVNQPWLDFVIQYFNKQAFLEALAYWQHVKNNEPWQQEFYPNGSRTQNFYKLDKTYRFDHILPGYLAWIYLDPRYYASKAFENPASLEAGIQEIKAFKRYLAAKGIRLRLVSCPEERSSLALVYYSGLGKTYEAYRKALADIQPFYDLNLDTSLTATPGNYWDTHHVRQGGIVVKDLQQSTYLVTPQTVDKTVERIRPTQAEMDRLKSILNHYTEWKTMKKTIDNDLIVNPARK